MIASKYRWDVSSPDERAVADLGKRLNVSRLTAGVLASRGWSAFEETEAFLRAGEADLLDPFLMKGMAEAVDRITRAIKAGERIRVYGDYDADGVTSTTLMSRLLSGLGARFDTYIPHRSKEGYGLNRNAIDLAAEAGVSLIITVDNGISAVEQIAYASERGIQVVVTDHHEPPEILPDAVALVNPKQKDCGYPFKGLCGAGVVFKLGHALMGRPVLEHADLAAIGTIADLMPLTGENRIIARIGLELMRSEPSPGIRALCKVCGVKPEELTSGRIGFGLAPRLNAGGRLEHADGAVKLLAAGNEQEAEHLAEQLDRLNSERQRLVEQTLIEADDMWQSSCSAEGPRNVIVIAKEGWNAGIAGLVASKLVERYYRPAVILACDPATGLCKGSARSIDGFDLYEALTECAGLMEHYGGHQAAAGLTIASDRVVELREGLHRQAGEWLSPEHWQPKKRADLHCRLEDVTLGAAEELALLEPFGNGNPTPRFVIGGVLIRESRILGKEGKHLRLTVEQNGQTVEAVGFGMGEQSHRMIPGIHIDLLGELSINEWNGTRRIQLVFQDWKTDHLLIYDRRSEKDPWMALDNLLANQADGDIIGCASPGMYQEAMSRFGHTAIPIYLLSEGSGSRPSVSETAAAAEPDRVQQPKGWRQLFLLGLPEDVQHVRTLQDWLHPACGGECVHLFSEPRNARTAAKKNAFPERSHFAEVYAKFREKGSWLDSPDGFMQETALSTGWPLSVVRMMEEVFIELGFIAAQGATRKIAAKPERKGLEESARYRKAREQFEASALPYMPSQQLRSWFSACHSVNTNSI